MLLARRSRHYAGTRYLKRGVSDRGKVANDVEHEQIIHDESTSPEGVFSSYLQIRGSIPTFWTQESSAVMPKPPILINRVDPTYQATQLHFEDLLKRYGSPIIVVDLVKQSEKREREVIVGKLSVEPGAVFEATCEMKSNLKAIPSDEQKEKLA